MMLFLFFLLGISSHGKLASFSVNYIWAAIALASSYVAATTVNDIADRDIDSVNHRSSKGRPLITGEATEKDLYVVHLLAVAIVAICSSFVGLNGMVLGAVSLAISYVYSVRPFKLSYRTHFVPVILSVAYVVIPYWLGAVVAKSVIGKQELVFVLGLLSLFCGRIILKDFRDRKGDALYGKPTFLLRYGKTSTCVVSGVVILTGNICIFAGLPSTSGSILMALELFFFSILFMLYRLWKAGNHETEQKAIGIGAKMGNGLLVTVLGMFVLLEYGAPLQTRLLFVSAVTAMFMLNFFVLIAKPEYPVIGYRG
jgi:4-hydroxybenzoate polyprenyltransferase